MEEHLSFEGLQLLINEVSRAQSSRESIDLALDHLTKSPLFGFDYAIFSEVNYLNEYLRILYSTCNNPLIIDPVEWRKGNGIFSLNGNDVMAVAVKEDAIINVNGAKKNGRFDYTLDKEVFEKFGHSDLLRYFVPLTDRKKANLANAAGDATVGLLEMGCHTTNAEKFEAVSEIQLKLYADNLAQSYQRNYYNEQRESLRKSIVGYEKEATDHLDFLHHILQDCRETTGADYANIGFLSMDDSSLWQTKDKLISGNPEAGIRLKSLSARIIERIARKNSPELMDERELKETSPEQTSIVRSCLLVPLSHSETVLGIMCLSSRQSYFFNEFKVKYAMDITRDSMHRFLDLKIANAVQTLVKPFSFYNKTEIYEQSCSRLSKYFSAKYIGFWENEINRKDLFKQKFVSKSLSGEFPEIYKIAVKSGASFESEDASIVLLKDHAEANTLTKFAFTAGFTSMVYIPLKTHRGVSSFIVIFSHRNIERLFPEDKTLFNHLGSKARLSLAYSDIFSFFEELSLLNYEEDIDTILDPLLNSIQRIIGADLLLLFRFNEEGEFMHGITKGGLKNEKLERRIESREMGNEDFSYIVLEKGNLWIENQDQYYEQFRKEKRGWIGGGEFKQDFWEREKIESLAAVRIEYGGDHFGVLFYNFRTAQRFDNDTKSLIDLLSNSVARVMAFSQTQILKDKYEKEKTEEMHSFAETELAKSVLHNINNLFSDVGYAFSALKNAIDKADISNNAKDAISRHVETLGQDINAVANDYLLFRKYMQSEDQEIASCLLLDLVNEALNVVRFKLREKRITVRLEFGKNEQVMADKLQIVHVILNLVKNAIEANAKQIWISCEQKLERFRSGDVNFKIIGIRDNGSGIKEDVRTRIFQPKFTTKKDGTGMGLPMSQHILERHEGRLDFRSQPGGVTIFNIYLPHKA